MKWQYTKAKVEILCNSFMLKINDLLWKWIYSGSRKIFKYQIVYKSNCIIEHNSAYKMVIKRNSSYNEQSSRYWTCLIWANFLLTFKDRIWFKFEMWLALFDVSLMSANLEVCSFAWYWKLWLTQVLSIQWMKICSAWS